MDHVLTQQDFAVFKEAVDHWMGFFGLKDWNYEFQMCQLDPGVGAETRFNRPGRLVTFCLGQIWVTEAAPTAKDVRKSAFHEVCEVLLDDMEWEALAQCEKAYEDFKADYGALDAKRHAVIRRLENSVFEALTE